MILSAVIPTIQHREFLLDQTIRSLTETANCEVELIVVRDAPTIGEAWNEGAGQATGSHLWLGADDVTFSQGWLEAASEYGYPTPRILNADGSVGACGTLGQGAIITREVEEGFPCASSQFPLMEMAVWRELIGPSLPIGYYADDYLGFRARQVGLFPMLCRGYTLIHHEGTAGRARTVARAMDDRQRFIDAVTEENLCERSLSPAG